MAASSVNDSTSSINHSISMQTDFSRMDANDQLIESLQKALALTTIFACSSLGNYDENTLQFFSSAILDNLYAANEALEFLHKNKGVCL